MKFSARPTRRTKVIFPHLILKHVKDTITKEGIQDWMFEIHPEFDDDLLEELAGGLLTVL